MQRKEVRLQQQAGGNTVASIHVASLSDNLNVALPE